MKHTYEKPVITVDAGMAEGVYAASGAGNTTASSITAKFLRYDGDWGSGGTAVFSIDLSNMNSSQLTVVLTFNMTISGAWGGGASATVSGSQATLDWYSAPSSAEISIQVQGSDVKQLEFKSATYSNK